MPFLNSFYRYLLTKLLQYCIIIIFSSHYCWLTVINCMCCLPKTCFSFYLYNAKGLIFFMFYYHGRFCLKYIFMLRYILVLSFICFIVSDNLNFAIAFDIVFSNNHLPCNRLLFFRSFAIFVFCKLS